MQQIRLYVRDEKLHALVVYSELASVILTQTPGIRHPVPLGESFVLATLVFCHFSFTALNFDILFLPRQFLIIHHFRPSWGKNKMKMVKFRFAFALVFCF